MKDFEYFIVAHVARIFCMYVHYCTDSQFFLFISLHTRLVREEIYL